MCEQKGRNHLQKGIPEAQSGPTIPAGSQGEGCFPSKCLNQTVGGDREAEAGDGNLRGQSTWCMDFVCIPADRAGDLCLQDQETLLGDQAPNLGYKEGKT